MRSSPADDRDGFRVVGAWAWVGRCARSSKSASEDHTDSEGKMRRNQVCASLPDQANLSCTSRFHLHRCVDPTTRDRLHREKWPTRYPAIFTLVDQQLQSLARYTSSMPCATCQGANAWKRLLIRAQKDDPHVPIVRIHVWVAACTYRMHLQYDCPMSDAGRRCHHLRHLLRVSAARARARSFQHRIRQQISSKHRIDRRECGSLTPFPQLPSLLW